MTLEFTDISIGVTIRVTSIWVSQTLPCEVCFFHSKNIIIQECKMRIFIVAALLTFSAVTATLACPAGQYERCHYLSGGNKTCYCTK